MMTLLAVECNSLVPFICYSSSRCWWQRNGERSWRVRVLFARAFCCRTQSCRKDGELHLMLTWGRWRFQKTRLLLLWLGQYRHFDGGFVFAEYYYVFDAAESAEVKAIWRYHLRRMINHRGTRVGWVSFHACVVFVLGITLLDESRAYADRMIICVNVAIKQLPIILSPHHRRQSSSVNPISSFSVLHPPPRHQQTKHQAFYIYATPKQTK